MTLKSIRDEVRARAADDDGRLVLVEPRLNEGQPRVIYLTKKLHEQIVAAACEPAGSTAYRIGMLQDDFDWFITGKLITVGYGKEPTCRMKPLEPRTDEVWEIRSRDPKPALRVFGRFSETDVFIATHMAWREDLGGWGAHEWAREIRKCKAIWRQLFPSYAPHSGAHVHDYISDDVIEIGHLP